MSIRVADVVRLFSAILLLAIAMLSVFRAPTHFLWMVAIGATEWGHAFALICFVFVVPLWSSTRIGKFSAALCVVGGVLAMTPVIRGSEASRILKVPISYFGLFTGLSVPDVRPKTLTYKTIDREALELDFYPATTAGNAPVIVVVHGGAWNSGDNKDFTGFDRYFASRGFAVADIMYRLAPRWRYPAASDDLRSAMEFLALQSDALKIDPDQLVLLGRSAGAQIALDVAYSDPTVRIRGVISFYGPVDLRWSWDHPGNPLVIDTRQVLAEYLGGDPVQAGPSYDAASPIRHVTSGVPPTLLFHGERDEFVSAYHNAALSGRLTAAGVLNLSISLGWATHGFDYILRGPGGQISTHVIERFLAQVLARR